MGADPLPNTVYVGRPSEWGNPFRISRVTDRQTLKHEWWVETPENVWTLRSKEEAHEMAVRLFRHWVYLPPQRRLRDRAMLALKGKNLACWCKPGEACHANVWLEMVNG